MVRLPDGTAREINKRGFVTKTAAVDWLKAAQVDGKREGYIEPSRQRLGAYGAEVIAGLRLKPQTAASYRKNWRNHIESYPLAALPLAQLTGVKLTAHYRVLEKSGRKDHRAGELLFGDGGVDGGRDGGEVGGCSCGRLRKSRFLGGASE